MTATRGENVGQASESLEARAAEPATRVIGSILSSVTRPIPRLPRKPVTAPAVAGAAPEVAAYREKFSEIERMLMQNRSLALLYIDASRLSQIEQDYGSRIYEEVLRLLTNLILEMRGVETRQDDLVTVSEKHGDVFLIFLSQMRKERPFGRGDLEHLADRIHGYLSKRLYRMTSSFLRGRPKLSIGYSLVLFNPLVKVERLLLKLIEEARRMAEFQSFRLEVKNKELLQEIILKEDVRTLFQPILDLREPTVLGYEALTRGPKGTEFESPYMLFEIASESDLLFELDRLCRRKALMAAAGLDPDYKLFVNILPMTIRDPEFQGRLMIDFLDKMNLDPSRIVLEITERLAIENYSLFMEAMNYFTDMGFAVAVDDMGAGYSGLEKIVHLRPAYLKFDLLMVRDIDTSFVKKEMLKAVLTLAQNVGASVIAEGVETSEELEALVGLGIHYGQGFLFSRAKPGFFKAGTLSSSEAATPTEPD